MTEPIKLTDHRGERRLFEDEYYEPEPGSILLTEGIYGTAWQRMFKDGKWYATRGGTPRSWNQLLRKRNVLLVHDAPKRKDQVRGESDG